MNIIYDLSGQTVRYTYSYRAINFGSKATRTTMNEIVDGR